MFEPQVRKCIQVLFEDIGLNKGTLAELKAILEDPKLVETLKIPPYVNLQSNNFTKHEYGEVVQYIIKDLIEKLEERRPITSEHIRVLLKCTEKYLKNGDAHPLALLLFASKTYH